MRFLNLIRESQDDINDLLAEVDDSEIYEKLLSSHNLDDFIFKRSNISVSRILALQVSMTKYPSYMTYNNAEDDQNSEEIQEQEDLDSSDEINF